MAGETYIYKTGKLTKKTDANTIEVRMPHVRLEHVYAGGGTTSEGTSIYDSVNGTIKADYIPNLNASKITTGVLDKSVLPSSVDDIVELLTYATSAPSTCSTGDQYFNSSNNKIYTATATNTWGTTGEDPSTNAIYYILSSHKSYRWGGSSMVEIAASLATTTEVRTSGASNDFVPTELAVRTAINAGGVSFATQNEVYTGTETGKVVSPATLQGKFDKHFFRLTAVTDTAPSSGVSAGDYYFNTDSHKFYTYSNSSWSETTVSDAWLFITSGGKVYAMNENSGNLELVASPIGNYEIPGVVKIEGRAEIAANLESGDSLPVATDVAVVQADIAALIPMFQRTITVTAAYGLAWNSSTRTISLTLVPGAGIASVTGGTITAELDWEAD